MLENLTSTLFLFSVAAFNHLLRIMRNTWNTPTENCGGKYWIRGDNISGTTIYFWFRIPFCYKGWGLSFSVSKHAGVYSEHSQTSKMEAFAKYG